MSNSGAAIRNKLYDYIRVADEKRLFAIYNLLEQEIERTEAWWKDKKFITELDRRYKDLETGKDIGLTLAESEAAIDKIRKKKYGR